MIEPNRTVSEPESSSNVEPNVEKKKKKKRRKMKYSRGTGVFQKAVRGFNKGLRTATEGLVVTVEAWNDAWDRSARKKKDGALHDVIPNSAKAVTKGLIISSKAVKRVYTRVAYPSGATVIRLLVPPLWFVK